MTDSPNLALAEEIEALCAPHYACGVQPISSQNSTINSGWLQTGQHLPTCPIAIAAKIRALRAQPSGDWIPVSERFPSDLEIVQVWGTTEDEDEGWSVAQYDADGGNWHIRFDGGCVSIEIVTHWMPLPQPPALSAAKELGRA